MAIRINENNLSKTVALLEAGRTQVTIAQIKEVQRLLLDELANMMELNGASSVLELIERHQY